MRQGLSKSASTYFQFLEIVFRFFPQIDTVAKIPTIKDTEEKTTFVTYMDNHLSLAKTFKDMYKFLHKYIFCMLQLELIIL